MAANKTLDPSTITKASEAFVHPLPQVRQFHRALATELDEKNTRLRILVGGSYRDLLGTAEMILTMRDEIAVVEDKLGKVGRGCGKSVIGGMVTGLGKLEGKRREEGTAGVLGWTARMKVLGMCGVVLGRLLRRAGDEAGRGQNLVLAAKVWVLSRLLAKSLGDSAASSGRVEEKEMVEESRKRMNALRRKMLRAIDRVLEKVGEDARDEEGRRSENLAQALCAYSLATSSGAKDVLIHFLKIRGEAIALAFEDPEDMPHEVTPGILTALKLYIQTVLDVQALVPRQLSDILASLKSKPLLKDESIRELEGLRLDIGERWFGDEILYFTPYVRNDDLEGSVAVEALRGWVKKASEVLITGFNTVLEKVTEFKAVVELRTKVLEVWIADGGKPRGFDPFVMLNSLRDAVNVRLTQLLQARVGKLHLIGTEIESTIEGWTPGETDKNQSLWDEDILELDIGGGATLFKKSIIARTYGRNDAVSKAFAAYQTWYHLVDELSNAIEQLRRQRWNDNLEDIEDDDSIESRQQLLSSEDPQMLQDELNTGLENAFSQLDKKITALWTTAKETENAGHISMYILRILRDIRLELPRGGTLHDFGLSIIPSLHQELASAVATDSIMQFTKSFNRKKVVGRSLWEGTPELPVQPSPATFKFFYATSKAMADAGADLWSPAAIDLFKKHLRSEIGGAWKVALDSYVENESTEEQPSDAAADGDGNAAPEADSTQKTKAEKRREVMIQSLFDIYVLENSLEISKSPTDDKLEELEKTISSQLELESTSIKRLQQSSKEYWKRTNLLFGLLA
ncbi:hypothetical protein F5884DRAFT_768037 [Xylogone sp. PMI_703]|nr:hypothetical protein F5884DRAFT_768037 [Xylogone sp. PMI_703]